MKLLRAVSMEHKSIALEAFQSMLFQLAACRRARSRAKLNDRPIIQGN
jgi:hypothetical protein